MFTLHPAKSDNPDRKFLEIWEYNVIILSENEMHAQSWGSVNQTVYNCTFVFVLSIDIFVISVPLKVLTTEM